MIHRVLAFLSTIKPTRLGVLFAVLIGLGVGFWQWGQPPRPRVVLENLGSDLHVYFSPDGRTLATVCTKDSASIYFLALWDVETGLKKADLFKGQERWARPVVFSPDGRALASRFRKQIRVWNLSSGEEVATYDDKDGNDHSQLVFSPEGKLLAVRRNYVLWDVVENKIVKELVLEMDGEWAIPGGDNSILVVRKGDIVNIWYLGTVTLCAERRDFPKIGNLPLKLTCDRRFLLFHNYATRVLFIYDLLDGKNMSFQRKICGELPWPLTGKH
jgi:hypothetical protein